MTQNEKEAVKPSQETDKELERLKVKLAIEETKLKIMQTKAQQSALKSAMNETSGPDRTLAKEPF
jgi:hypothetical protein